MSTLFGVSIYTTLASITRPLLSNSDVLPAAPRYVRTQHAGQIPFHWQGIRKRVRSVIKELDLCRRSGHSRRQHVWANALAFWPESMPASKSDVRTRSRTAAFTMLVRDFARPRTEVLLYGRVRACAEVVERLANEKLSCAIVLDRSERPIGILTERDITRRIAFRTAPDTPVEAVMTSPVMTIARREYLYYAISWMRRHELRHMPAVDRAGRIVGILYLHDALAAASEGLMRQIDRLTPEGPGEPMKQVKSAQVDLAEELFADHLPAPEIQQVLSHINNDLYRRIGESALKKMTAEGWGDCRSPPPRSSWAPAAR